VKLDIQSFLSSKHAKWLIIALISLFCLLTVSEYSKLIWSLSEPEPSPASEEQIIVPTKKDSFDSLVRSSLFGVYVSNDLSGDNVKKSMLDITLVGILLGNTANDSQVIIRTANGEEKNYRVNDKIPGGVVLKRIMAGGILVEHNGSLERVTLQKEELKFEPAAKPLKANSY
jgi:general secretion pathway protein C